MKRAFCSKHFSFNLTETKLKRGLEYAAVRLKVQSDSFFKKSEGIHVKQDFSTVTINGVEINTEGVVEATAVMVLAFVAFNLEHSVSYRDVVELIECVAGFRSSKKEKIRLLVVSL